MNTSAVAGRVESFTTPEEQALSAEFLEQGYVIRDVDNPDGLRAIRQQVVELACRRLGRDIPNDADSFLNRTHEILPVAELNELRMAIYGQANALPWFRPTYFSLVRRAAELLVGNELAMQNRVNLSIQLPHDDSSLLGIHADAFSGETPFEVVQWVPLVDVEDTKAMFLLPPAANRRAVPRLKQIMEEGGTQHLFDTVQRDLVWIRVPFGRALIFSPTLLHGNTVNSTDETRWSLNCRITGLFTPYASSEKSLGGFYLPITTKVVSRVGLNYQAPEGFREQSAR